MDVVLVAVKKDVINEYISVVKESGLNPLIVDVDAFAHENMYGINYDIEPDRNVALLNIGASTINMSILKGGISVFTRDSSLGSNLHTEALQREFNLSYENAEKLKRGELIENVDPDSVGHVIESASEEILSEIVRSVEYYRSTTMHEDIAEVILSGGCALLPNFAAIIAEKTGVETKVAEPFRNIRIPKKFDLSQINEIAPIMSIAVGLAMRKQGDR